MKALCFFFSIWILVCSGMPCADCDTHGHGDGHAHESVHMPVTEKELGFDLCSPLCSCACCAVSVSLPFSMSFFPRLTPLPAQRDVFVCPPIRDFPSAAWQPPRHSRT